jgi:hypothetical protein
MPTTPTSMTGHWVFGAAVARRSQQEGLRSGLGPCGGVGTEGHSSGAPGQQPPHPTILPGDCFEAGERPQHFPPSTTQHHPGGSASRRPHAKVRNRQMPLGIDPSSGPQGWASGPFHRIGRGRPNQATRLERSGRCQTVGPRLFPLHACSWPLHISPATAASGTPLARARVASLFSNCFHHKTLGRPKTLDSPGTTAAYQMSLT